MTCASGCFAWVPLAATDSVVVIDTSGQIATLSPAGDYPREIAMSPNGSRAFVSNHDSSNISVFDTSTAAIVATVPVGSFPDKIAVTPNGSYVYAANDGGGSAQYVWVVDTSASSVVATITFGTNGFNSLLVRPDGSFVYVGDGASSVLVVGTTSHAVVATAALTSGQIRLRAVTPNGSFVFVSAYLGSPPLSVMSTASNSVIGSVAVGQWPAFVTILPNGSTGYVGWGGSTLSVFDVATRAVTSSITVAWTPFHGAVTPDGSSLYVSTAGGVYLIDTASNSVVNTVPLDGDGPMAITPNGSRVYVINNASNAVDVINVATNSVVATVGACCSPWSVAIRP